MQVFRTDFQINTFLYIFYIGFFFCGIHELTFLLFREKPLYARLIKDLMLAVSVTFALFLAICASGGASLRFYMAAAFVLGMLLYHINASLLFKKIFSLRHRKRK